MFLNICFVEVDVTRIDPLKSALVLLDDEFLENTNCLHSVNLYENAFLDGSPWTRQLRVISGVVAAAGAAMSPFPCPSCADAIIR